MKNPRYGGQYISEQFGVVGFGLTSYRENKTAYRIAKLKLADLRKGLPIRDNDNPHIE